MTTAKSRVLAAIPYLLMLVIVVNVHFLGLADFFFFGVNISLISLIPYILAVLILSREDDPFVRRHTHASLAIFFVYFVLTAVFGVIMYMLGYRIYVIDPVALMEANTTTWLVVGSLLAILIYVVVCSVQGLVACFKGVVPHMDAGEE